ncbi:MAG: bacterial Ig-like domain-containing protein, partial [Candidatus Ornithomonoglobus sp.]
MKKQLSGLLAAAMAVTSMGFVPITVSAVDKAATAEVSYNYDGQDHTRQMEKLDRGLVAVKTGDGVFLSWRLNGDEASVGDIAGAPGFKVYKNGTLIATVDNSTNYLDKSGTVSDSYTVAPEGGEQCGAVTPMDNSYFDIKLDKPADFAVDEETSYSYTAGDASCGDLDGDGEYEIVIKWDANPQDNSIAGITGNVYLDAYKLDGTRLWRIDLGRNIRGGAHYTQFLVYDFDLDGKAEITCKTAPGSLDGKSEYVSAASSDSTIQSADNSVSYVNDGGYIIEGPEYFTIFDGETGAAIDTINYPVQRVSASVWGDIYGNRCDRFVADVSYMDGEKPYAVYWRGYYFGQSGYGERTGVFAASFDGERLSVPENHIFDTRSDQPGYRSGNEIYVGEGNHNMTTADVDDDGRDEVISGALCLEFDDNDILSPKWCTFKEHGDALHIGDYDPTHQGLEFFTIHEDGGGVNIYGGVTLDFGASVIDPATGEIMKHWSGSKDTGRGLMANVGAGGYYQITAAAGINGWYCLGGGNFESGASIGQNFRVFWDGDLYDETLDGTTISAWNGSGMSGIFTADGCVSINGTKATPSLQADLFGDWREEVAYPLTDSSALRIFTTTDITEYKLPTLMHDPVYRSGVASEQSAYNQPPHIGFYLADEIFRPAVDYIEITKAPDKTEYTIGESLDLTGLEVTAHFTDGSSDIVTNYVVTGYNPDTDSEQTITVTYGKKTTEFTVRVNSGFTIDDNGYITGYTPDNESAVVPAVINGIPVKGFADGALTGSSLKSITISADETEIGNNVFPEGITIICYIGSDAYTYAVEHGIAYEIVETREFSANVTYSESGYSGWSMVQGGTAQTYQVGHITYGVPGRTNRGQPGGDGVSGFFTQDIGGDAVLNCSVGRFSTNNRNAYFTLTDIPMASDTMDSVFETDIMFINNSGKAAQ